MNDRREPAPPPETRRLSLAFVLAICVVIGCAGVEFAPVRCTAQVVTLDRAPTSMRTPEVRTQKYCLGPGIGTGSKGLGQWIGNLWRRIGL